MRSASLPLVNVADLRSPAGQITRWIELNRPEKLNCLSLAMLDEVSRALEIKQADQLILTGRGRAFCTGLDLDEIAACGTAKAHLEQLARIYRRLLTAEIPTLVLARGYAIGGGAGLVACAQTALVSPDFSFRLPAGKLSALASVVVPLCKLRSPGITPAAGWLGCDLDAEAARQLGLVDGVLTPEQFSEAVRFGAGGPATPQLSLAPPRKPEAVRIALNELEQFLAGLD